MPRASASHSRPLAPDPAALVAAVPVLAGTASLREVRALLDSAGGAGLLVRSDVDHRIILPEYLAPFAGDEELATQLMARDLARPAPVIRKTCELRQLACALSDSAADAVIVLDEQGREPAGIVTRRALEARLLEWTAAAGEGSKS